jgi:hypothetical protein
MSAGTAPGSAPVQAQGMVPHSAPGQKPRRTWLAAAVGVLLVAAVGVGMVAWTTRDHPAAALVGTWEAEVTYPWPNAVYTERFIFRLEDGQVSGSASFLRVPRVITDVQAGDSSLRFSTRTFSKDGVQQWEDVHRYRVEPLGGDRLAVVMQTESQGAAREPLRFEAHRTGPAEAP